MSAGESEKRPDADAPRRASTVLLIRDDPFEVLMVERNSRGAFPSALVFPGGVVDSDDADGSWLEHVTGADSLEVDERSNRIAAVRELWEETGICLAVDGNDSGQSEDTSSVGIGFHEFMAATNLRIALDEIVPFGHWVTPVGEPRRFDTRFYLARSPLGHEGVADGAETVNARWVAPSDAGQLAARATVLFPTLMSLHRLAESSDSASALRSSASRAVVTVAPVMTRNDDGVVVITIPESAGYGVTEFRVAPPAS